MRGQRIRSSLVRPVVPSGDRVGGVRHVAGGYRWYPTTPAHSLAVAIHERIDPEAFLQGSGPPQSSRFPEAFLTQESEDCIVCLSFIRGASSPK